MLNALSDFKETANWCIKDLRHGGDHFGTWHVVGMFPILDGSRGNTYTALPELFGKLNSGPSLGFSEIPDNFMGETRFDLHETIIPFQKGMSRNNLLFF